MGTTCEGLNKQWRRVDQGALNLDHVLVCTDTCYPEEVAGAIDNWLAIILVLFTIYFTYYVATVPFLSAKLGCGVLHLAGYFLPHTHPSSYK